MSRTLPVSGACAQAKPNGEPQTTMHKMRENHTGV